MSKHLFISAAEPSGDIIAAEVIRHIKRLAPSTKISGIAGNTMQAEGVSSLFPMSDLTVMGFAEVIPKLRRIRQRLKETVAHILATQPEMVVTVDAYSFHYRLAKQLRQRGFKGQLIQLVAPAVWAWKPKRAEKLAEFYNQVLCIIPGEPDYFLKHGLTATFIGHPALYRSYEKSPDFRNRYGIPATALALIMLPGSRPQEITKLLPVFLDAADRLQQSHPDLHLIIPTLPHLVEEINALAVNANIPITLVTDKIDKFTCLHEARAAIAASGTVAIELAVYDLPFIIAYKTSGLTYWLAKRFAKVRYICLLNILADKKIIPELLQEECTAHRLFTTLEQLLNNDDYRQTLAQEMATIKGQLQCPASGLTPAEYAAELVLKA